VIDRPTRQSGSAAYDNNCRDTDTALYLFADGRCLRRNVVQAHDPDVIAFRHVHESRDDGWYKMRLRFAPLVSLEPRYPPHRRERHVEGLDLTSNSPSSERHAGQPRWIDWARWRSCSGRDGAKARCRDHMVQLRTNWTLVRWMSYQRRCGHPCPSCGAHRKSAGSLGISLTVGSSR
jgi:hypothetical protein